MDTAEVAAVRSLSERIALPALRKPCPVRTCPGDSPWAVAETDKEKGPPEDGP